jgi:hypothetical protein
MSSLLEGERCLKSEISSLLVEKSSLDARINTLISNRAGEKQVKSVLKTETGFLFLYKEFLLFLEGSTGFCGSRKVKNGPLEFKNMMKLPSRKISIS